MEDTDEVLKTNIHSILNSVSDKTVDDIIQAIKCAGVESLSDLQFVQEEDLILVLKPIPRRKLIKAWSKPIVMSPSSAPYSPSQLPDSPSSLLTSKSQKILTNSSLNCKWSWTKRFTLLQTYIKYMGELSSPNVDEQNVWRKIAKEVRENCSLNCDAAQCRYKVDGLRRNYERIKNKNIRNQHALMFLNEARKAFATAEKSVTPDPQVDDKVKADRYVPPFRRKGVNKKDESMGQSKNTITSNPQVEDKVKADKYVPPFMREGANSKGESMAPSRTNKETVTIRVANLPKDVSDSDLRKLFRPFGTIACIYITKNKSTGLPKGVAFIKYHKGEDANKAALAIDGSEYVNQILCVSLARGL